MKSVTLTIFSVLMIVCLTTTMVTAAGFSDEDYAHIAELLDKFDEVEKRGRKICKDPYMDLMSFKSSSFCRRKRREASLAEEQ